MGLSNNQLLEIAREGNRQFKEDLAAASQQNTRRLESAYRDVRAGVDKELQAFNAAIQARGMAATPDEFFRQVDLTGLVYELDRHLNEFSQVLASQGQAMQRSGKATGVKGGARVLGEVSAQFARPTAEQLDSLIGFVDDPNFGNFVGNFPQSHLNRITNMVLVNASQGKSPIFTANMITEYIQGYPLVDALRMTRTVQIYSAREGTRAIYQANKDIVKGWRWGSALDGRTCMSCLALHGKTFTLDDPLNDHFNGRCAMIPITRFNAGEEVLTGEQWFSKLPESEQRAIMGKAKWQAWKDNEFEFEDLTGLYDDPVFGKMAYARSLKEIRATSRYQILAQPEKFRPIPTEIESRDSFSFYEAMRVKPSDLEAGYEGENAELNRLWWEVFGYDDNAVPTWDIEKTQQMHMDILYDAYKLGRSEPRPEELLAARDRAGLVLAVYRQTGYQLSLGERRQLERLALGSLSDLADEFNGVRDKRMIGRSTGSGSGRRNGFLTAQEIDGRNQLRENRMRQNDVL